MEYVARDKNSCPVHETISKTGYVLLQHEGFYDSSRHAGFGLSLSE